MTSERARRRHPRYRTSARQCEPEHSIRGIHTCSLPPSAVTHIPSSATDLPVPPFSHGTYAFPFYWTDPPLVFCSRVTDKLGIAREKVVLYLTRRLHEHCSIRAHQHITGDYVLPPAPRSKNEPHRTFARVYAHL